MPTIIAASVHILYVLIFCHQYCAAFGRSLQRNEAIGTGEIKHIVHDRHEQDNDAVGWIENRVKIYSQPRRKREEVSDSGTDSNRDAGRNISSDNLQSVLIADHEKRAVKGDSGYGFRPSDSGYGIRLSDSGYGSRLAAAHKIAFGYLQRVLFADLGKRAVVSESRYGTRFDANHNISQYYLHRSLFACMGNRAMDVSDTYISPEQQFLMDYGFRSSLTEDMVKRMHGVDSHSRRKRAVVGDSGYGSRLYAAHIVAHAKLQKKLIDDIGKRAAVIASGYGSRLGAAQNVANDNLLKCIFADLGKRSAVSYNRYSSRLLDAGHNVANDSLQKYLFADLGKRAVNVTDM
ncbi:hypothetical protein DPMN_192928 [Dreissena polymorpha]|uniref:Uncharacterized protein n=1 Tax=Dreissena polymorpha TaxID=45954 RepID=A0A9D3Y384_DREPO|nr:hypothetical protein DPMN_192928 [Dreissena polymorpha]